MKMTKIIKIQNLTTNWTNLKSVSNEETKIYTDGRTEVDEGNDVYDIIEDIKREEISDDFKSIKMLNQLLKNIIDYRMNAFQQPMVLFHRYLSFLLIRYQRNNHQDMMMILLIRCKKAFEDWSEESSVLNTECNSERRIEQILS
ncbi:UNVERIFIED_CONTAM: hypothetical protein RMT77_006559 [Armadillidium vulgare]